MGGEGGGAAGPPTLPNPIGSATCTLAIFYLFAQANRKHRHALFIRRYPDSKQI